MNELVANIRRNLEGCQENIRRAAEKSGRVVQDVRLVVVTKSQPVKVIEAAIDAGAQFLGENYPEETLSKIAAIGHPASVEWHMIGHLQSRKAKIVADHFNFMQSLDSVDIARKLNRLLIEQNKTLPVLLEINVGGEESKFGWRWESPQDTDTLISEVAQIVECSNLQVKGLMTMPPIFEDANRVRPCFQKLRKLSEYLAMAFRDVEWGHLSMGTSSDYEIAVEEGATIVRIGTAIVGARLRKE